MIINHNMASLNTYRQMSTNMTNTSKSLEKLSSGLRINKAGDDAAGLAISEKMRGQIRGLDQAARNGQDGISMLNTAEGALSETHSILQRMKELATQSANDTNTTSDRSEIQKEMNQLTSEVNRIGNTTEFNTQKLLNGGGEVKEIAINTKQAGGAAGAFEGAVDLIAAGAGAAEKATLVAGGVTQTINFHADNASNANNLKVVYAAGGAANATAAFDGTDTITITTGTGAAHNLASVVEGELQGLDLSSVGVDASKITVTGDVLAVADDTALSAAAKIASGPSTLGTEAIVAGSKSATVTADTTSVKAVAAEWTSGALTALADTESGSVSFAGVTISLDADDDAAEGLSGTNQVGSTVKFDTNAGATADTAQAQLIVDAFNAVKAEQGANGSLANFTFETDAAGTGLKITGTTEDGATNNTFKLTSTGDAEFGAVPAVLDAAASTAGITEIRGEYSFEIDKAFEVAGATFNVGGQFQNTGVTLIGVEGTADASKGEFSVGGNKEEQAISIAQALNGSSLSDRFDAIVDGSKITLREKATQATGVAISNGVVANNASVEGEFSFSVDSSVAVGGKYAVDGVNIAVTDDVNNKGLADGTAVLFSADKTQQASNLANAISANSTLNAKYTATASSNTITLEQKAGQESMVAAEAITSTSSKDGFQATFQVGANTAQSMTIEVNDMRADALKISGDTAGGSVTASNGNVATLKATKEVTNGTNNTTTEYALDVSTHEKATAAISVLDDAIQSVSAERSKIGAYTNRLDHTITNLGTSSENLTAAESRVRDVDMAKEMMQFQKNNILSQAAQAMMAQANQQPQGVLQLLR